MTGDDPAGDLARRRAAWIDCVGRGDLDGYADVVTSGVVWVPPGGEAVVGRTAFRAWVGRFFGEFSYRLTLEPEHVRTRGDWAFEQGRFQSRFRARSAGSPAEHQGGYCVIWQRCPDGLWRIDRYFDTS